MRKSTAPAWLTYLLIVGALSASAESECGAGGYGGSRRNPARVLPGGIAFPAIYQAPNLNPTGLVASTASAIDFGFAPSTEDGKSDYGEVGVFTSQRRLALGVQYQTARRTPLGRTHGVAAAAAAKFDQVEVGAGIRDEDLSSTTDLSVDTALNVHLDKHKEGVGGTNFGAVVYSINRDPRLGTYLGWIDERSHFLEANLVVPLTSTSSRYEAAVATGVYIGSAGLSLKTRYFTDTKSFVTTVGAAVWLNRWTNISLQYDIPQNFTIRALLTF